MVNKRRCNDFICASLSLLIILLSGYYYVPIRKVKLCCWNFDLKWRSRFSYKVAGNAVLSGHRAAGLSYWNGYARSLTIEKLDELKVGLIVYINNASVVCVSETWFRDYIVNDSLNVHGFTLERNDRKHGRAGGLACYIRTDLGPLYSRLNAYEDDELEFTSRIPVMKSPVCVCVCVCVRACVRACVICMKYRIINLTIIIISMGQIILSYMANTSQRLAHMHAHAHTCAHTHTPAHPPPSPFRLSLFDGPVGAQPWRIIAPLSHVPLAMNGRSVLHSSKQWRMQRGIRDSFWCFSRIKNILGRTETRTRDRMCFQSIRTVWDISRPETIEQELRHAV